MNPFVVEALQLSTYVVIHWAFTVATSLWLLRIFRSRRYLFVKPSMVILGYVHVFFQWPAALNATHFERFLPDPYSLVVAVHGAALLGLVVAVNTHDRSARMMWDRLLTHGGRIGKVALRTTVLLAVVAGGVVAMYLSVVPFTETGLYAIFKNPALAALARENSLKLLENRTLAYAFIIMTSGIAPLLAVLLALAARQGMKTRSPVKVLMASAALAALLIAVSLTGARGFSVNLIAVAAVALVLCSRLPGLSLRLIGGVALVLAPAVVLTVLREGQSAGPGIILEYLLEGVVQRVFVAPLEVGAWYLHYAQEHGALGVAAIPKLATWLGIAPLDAPNLIALRYSPYISGPDTASAGAGYLLTYVSYFGTPAIVLTVGGVWLTDLALAVYRRLDNELLLPCVASCTIAALAFISADYSTVWISHGFGVILVVSLILSRIFGRRSAAIPRGSAGSPPIPAWGASLS